MRQRRGAHAAGQEDRVLRALEQGVLPGQGDLVGVVAVAAVEDVLVAADRDSRRCCSAGGPGPPAPSPAGAAGRRGWPWWRARTGARSSDEERVVPVVVGPHQPVEGERVERRLARAPRPTRARARQLGRAVSAPRAQTQANAARASAVTQPSSRGAAVLLARASAATASRWWVSTCSIASCWSSRSPCSTTNRPPRSSSSRSSLATTSSAQLKSSSSMPEKSSRAVRQSESARPPGCGSGWRRRWGG